MKPNHTPGPWRVIRKRGALLSPSESAAAMTTTERRALEELRAELAKAPHGSCSQCGAPLSRVEARDRSHRCEHPLVRLLRERTSAHRIHRTMVLALGLSLLALAVLAR